MRSNNYILIQDEFMLLIDENINPLDERYNSRKKVIVDILIGLVLCPVLFFSSVLVLQFLVIIFERLFVSDVDLFFGNLVLFAILSSVIFFANKSKRFIIGKVLLYFFYIPYITILIAAIFLVLV